MLLGVGPTEKFLKIIVGYFVYSNARRTALAIESTVYHWMTDEYDSSSTLSLDGLDEFLDF